MDLAAQFFNLFNRSSAAAVNPYFGTGVTALPSYGQSIQAVMPRQVQLVANFEY